MKITVGKAVIECDASELPAVLKSLNGQVTGPEPKRPIVVAKPAPAPSARKKRRKWGSVSGDILKLVAKSADGCRSADIAKLLGYPLSRASSELARLVRNGKLSKEPTGDHNAFIYRVAARGPVVARPVVPTRGPSLSGANELLMQHILENKVLLPIDGDGVRALAGMMYGSKEPEAVQRVRGIIWYQVKKGNLKSVGHGEFDLT